MYFGYKYYKKRKQAQAEAEAQGKEPNYTPKVEVEVESGLKIEDKRVKEVEDLIEAFHCPISQQLIEEPVSSKYGHLYEKAEIERWVNKYHTCPMTS